MEENLISVCRECVILNRKILAKTLFITQDLTFKNRFPLSTPLPDWGKMHCMICISIISSEDKMDFGTKKRWKKLLHVKLSSNRYVNLW